MEFGGGGGSSIYEWALFFFNTHIREAGLRPSSSAAGTKSWARIEGLDGRRGGLPALRNTPVGACSQAALLNARGAHNTGC